MPSQFIFSFFYPPERWWKKMWKTENSPLFSCHRRNFLYKNYGYLHSINITLVVLVVLSFEEEKKKRRTPEEAWEVEESFAPNILSLFATLTYLRCCDGFFLFRLIMAYVYFHHLSPSLNESISSNLYTFSVLPHDWTEFKSAWRGTRGRTWNPSAYVVKTMKVNLPSDGKNVS